MEREALKLDATDFDLERAAVCLDVNKTDDPRAWALHPGTAAAMRAWGELRLDIERVFVGEHGRPFSETARSGCP